MADHTDDGPQSRRVIDRLARRQRLAHRRPGPAREPGVYRGALPSGDGTRPGPDRHPHAAPPDTDTDPALPATNRAHGGSGAAPTNTDADSAYPPSSSANSDAPAYPCHCYAIASASTASDPATRGRPDTTSGAAYDRAASADQAAWPGHHANGGAVAELAWPGLHQTSGAAT